MDKGIAKDIFEFYFEDESMIDKKHVKEAIKWQTNQLKKAKKRIKELEVLLCPCECEAKQEEPNKEDLRELYKNDPTLIPEDFTDWWEGQKVWDINGREYEVIRLYHDIEFCVKIKNPHDTHSLVMRTNGSIMAYSEKVIYPYPVEVIKKQNQ